MKKLILVGALLLVGASSFAMESSAPGSCNWRGEVIYQVTPSGPTFDAPYRGSTNGVLNTYVCVALAEKTGCAIAPHGSYAASVKGIVTFIVPGEIAQPLPVAYRANCKALPLNP